MEKRAEGAFDARTARAWAEVDQDALRHNVTALQRLASPPTEPAGEAMAVVKADAYGHGSVPVARLCAHAGIGHFAVASVAEALELRQAGIRQEVYTLSPFLPAEAAALVQADIVPFISSREQAEALAGAARAAPLPARCFLVVDTGMGREGCLPDEAAALWRWVQTQATALRITGLATHFACADEPGEGDRITYDQTERFLAFLRSIENELTAVEDGRGGQGVYLTLANSPASLRLPHPDPPPGVRAYLKRGGLLLYGIEPYREAFAALTPEERPLPVLSWRARVTLLRDLPAGATIGYGKTYTLTRSSRIATLPVGYADGLSRKLSNRGIVLLNGQRFPLIGRVSMDQCQVDVTDAVEPIVLGDVATLIGTDSTEGHSVLQYAEIVGTTPHEPTCALTRRVPRLYGGSADAVRV